VFFLTAAKVETNEDLMKICTKVEGVKMFNKSDPSLNKYEKAEMSVFDLKKYQCEKYNVTGAAIIKLEDLGNVITPKHLPEDAYKFSKRADKVFFLTAEKVKLHEDLWHKLQDLIDSCGTKN